MKKFIVLILTLVLILFMFMFTACDKNIEEKTKIIIKVPAMGMYVQSDNKIASVADFLEKMAETYEKTHQDVDIEIAEYESAKEVAFVGESFGTPSAPDVLFDSFYNMRSYIYSGYVAPFDSNYINGYISSNNLDINQNALDAGMLGEKIYMLPFYSQQYVLAYNYSLLKSALLTAESYCTDASLKAKIKEIRTNTLPKEEYASNTIINFSDEEWEIIKDACVSYCEKMLVERNKHIYPYMMYSADIQGDSHILTTLMALGAQISEDGIISINNEKGVQALTELVNNSKNKWYPSKSENFTVNDCVELFLNSQMIFNLCTNSLYNQYRSNLNFGLVNYQGNFCENIYYGFEVFDNNDLKKLSIAKDFVKFIYTGKDSSNRENIRYSTAGIPVINNIREQYENDIVLYQQFSNNLSNCIGGDVDTYKVFAEGITNWNDVREVFHKEIQELLRGSKEPVEVAKCIEDEANQIILKSTGKVHK